MDSSDLTSTGFLPTGFASTEFLPTENALEILRYLESLMAHRGGSILLDEDGSLPLPVILLQVEADKPLILDLSSAREVLARVRRGEPFRLLGQSGNKLLRSDLLTATSCRENNGVVECELPLPEMLYVLQRRDSFRAGLRRDLSCEVVLDGGQLKRELRGELRDLSMGGCSVELPLAASTQVASTGDIFDLTLVFPNGRRLLLRAMLRHIKPDAEHECLTAGFAFLEPSPEQSRELWFFVREIEREAGRSAERSDMHLAPSPLFIPAERGADEESSAPRQYATPMAGRLARCADFLSLQIQSLRTGGNIDSVQLSRQAERLIRLFDQDREGLLFATVCLVDEPLLVKHGLGVAVRLADILGRSISPTVRKSVVACAMVHELGRALLPTELVWEEELSPGQIAESHRHVDLLLERLKDCGWLDKDVLSSVVAKANERLDGSGYPRQVDEQELGELARLMAVVDQIDFMSHRRPGVGAHSITRSYEYLLRRASKYDPLAVKHYMDHFGRLPIGTLLRYEGGQLAWVLGLDEALRPNRVQLAFEPGPPQPQRLGGEVSGRELAGLGRVAEILAGE